jgi:two-component system, cell cycle response regulator
MKILIVDDDPILARILNEILRDWNHEPVVAVDGLAALKILREENAPSLMILDWQLPVMTGVELCRYVRKSHENPYVYIIVLTSNQAKDGLVEALEAGADDFIVKPFDREELRVRIHSAVRILELQETLLSRARNDSLTSLLNHGAILEELSREFSRCRRERKPVSILLADIDHFKAINDTYGHQSGDAVLRAVSTRLLSTFRFYDHIGRYGGEEFLVVLPGCNITDAHHLSDRLRQRVSSESVELPGRSIEFTISIGIACIEDFETSSPQLLVRAADEALYKAKQRGRNRIEISSTTATVEQS